jgi:tetratricopeptide (TPR) repeat protein
LVTGPLTPTANNALSSTVTPVHEVRRDRLKKPLQMAIIAVMLSCFVVPILKADESEIDELLHHARTYYWLGLADKGNMDDFGSGLAILEETEQRLRGMEIDTEARDAYKSALERLREDLVFQADIAHDTFFGVLPLVRVLDGRVFGGESSPVPYVLFDDPLVIAATYAGEILTSQVLASWPRVPQMDVVVRSAPPAPDLENELLYLYSVLPYYYIHNDGEVYEALGDVDYGVFRSQGTTRATVEKLLYSFEVPELLVTTLELIDEHDGNVFYDLSAIYHSATTASPVFAVHQMGFSRDRTRWVPSIFLVNIAILFLAGLVFAIGTRVVRDERISAKTFLAFLVVVVIARLIPLIINPPLLAIAPAAERLVIQSVWWPILYGVVLVFFPFLAARLVLPRLQGMPHLKSLRGMFVYVMVGMALGVSAYFVSPAYLILQHKALMFVIPTLLTVVGLCAIIGRSTDSRDSLPTGFVSIAFAGSLVLGPVLSTVNATYMWFLLASIVVLFALVYGVHNLVRKASSASGAEADDGDATELDLVQRAIKMLKRPGEGLFVETLAFVAAKQHIEDALRKKKPAWVVLTGSEGRGKTTIARNLALSLERESGEAMCLYGQAAPPIGAGDSFSLFRDAFRGNDMLEAIVGGENALAGLDSGLQQIADSVLPIPLSVLFPGDEGDGPCLEPEILRSIAAVLRRVARKRRVICVLEDLQWIDSESKGLLKVLSETFRNGSDDVCFIITSQNDEIVAAIKSALGSALHVVDINEKGILPDAAKRNILIDELQFADAASVRILKEIRSLESRHGANYVFFRNIRHWLGCDVFDITGDDKLVFRGEYAKAGSLPLPPELKDEVVVQLEQFPQYKQILECASCIGMKFGAEVLAGALDKKRLDVISLLEDIEYRTGFIVDIGETDDYYRFSSSLLLGVIRSRIRLIGAGPRTTDIPQLVREYHHCIASTLEESYTKHPSQKALFSIARNYYASGSRGAGQTVRYALEAARSAQSIFAHGQVFEFLGMVDECMDFIDIGREQTNLASVRKQTHLLYITERVASGHFGKGAERLKQYMDESQDHDNEVLRCGLEVCAGHIRENGNAARAIYKPYVDSIGEILRSSDDPYDVAFAGLFGAQFAPDRDEAIQKLRHAIEKCKACDHGRADVLMARLFNSLGNKLMYLDPNQAEECFHRSLKLRDQSKPVDRQGMSYDHGGLGRLFLDRNDYERAEANFCKGLSIAEEIADADSVRTLTSFLAGALEKQGKTQEAHDRYYKSYDLIEREVDSGAGKDKFFAVAGLLTTSARLSSPKVNEYGNLLASHLKDHDLRVRDVAERLREVLAACEKQARTSWFGELVKLQNAEDMDAG